MTATDASPFSRRARLWLVGLVAGSFVFGLVLMIFGTDMGFVASAGHDTYSPSALGHRAFLALLKELGVPVVVSRHDSGLRAGRSAVLVLAEPPVAGERRAELEELLRGADTTLLVLPKRAGTADRVRPTWVDDTTLLDVAAVEEVLAVANVAAAVVRTNAPGRWSEPEPTLSSTQLLVPAGDSGIEAVISSDAGVLLAKVEAFSDRTLYVLSDPDLIATHGLGAGDNAAFTMALIDRVRDGRPLVIDETLHGYKGHPTIWRELFDVPLVLAVLQAAAILAVLVWSAFGRFGAPVPVPPPFEAGKGVLIANTADLLRYGGHSGHSLTRYFQTVLQDAGRALHAPKGLDGQDLRAWLDRIAASRGSRLRSSSLVREVAACQGRDGEPGIVRTARRIHHFRQELLDGPREHRPTH